MKRTRPGGELFALLAAIFWGLNYPIVKYILQSLPESLFLVIRFSAASILMLVLLLSGRQLPVVERKFTGRILLLGVLGMGVYNILWTDGIHRTSAGTASLLLSVSPVYTHLYAAIVQKEKIRPGQWAGLALAFAGICGILSPSIQNGSGADALRGDITILVCSIIFSYYGLAAKPLLAACSPQKLTTLVMLAGTSVLLPYLALVRPPAPYVENPTLTWGLMLYSIVFGTVIAYIFWYRGIQKASPARASLLYYFTPATGMLAGHFFLGEAMNAVQLAGAALLLLGIAITGKYSIRTLQVEP